MAFTRVTQEGVYVAAGTSALSYRITQAGVYAAVGEAPSAETLVTQIGVYAAVRSTPDFTWRDMFYELRFPTEISDGSEVGPSHNTDVTEVDSGFDQRLGRWDEGRVVFNVAYGVDTMQKMRRLADFHRIVKGRLIGFRIKDPSDYATWNWAGQDPGVALPTDASFGTGDASTTVFQLIKPYTYDDGEHTVQRQNRTISKPIASTVSVAVSGIEVSNFTVDETNGRVTFYARVSVGPVTDISFSSTQILSVSTDLSSFNVGNPVQVNGSGSNDTSGDNIYILTAKSSHALTVATTLTPESAGASVVVNTHPAPRSGKALTWGGEFDVPVRFTTDSLPLRLAQYNTGQAVVLVEEIRVVAS